MGNVRMEARQINYRGGESITNVEEAIKNAGSTYKLPIAGSNTLGGVRVGNGLSIDAETGVLSNAQTPYTPADYSTTEQNLGIKWIDGKDLYRIVIHETEETEQTSKNYSLASLNIDKAFIGMSGMVLGVTASSSYVSGNEYYDNTYNRSITLDASNLNVKANGWKFKEVWAEIFYTKTASEE